MAATSDTSGPSSRRDDRRVLPLQARCLPRLPRRTAVVGKAEPKVVQQAELIDRPLNVAEPKAIAYWCTQCRKVLYAPMPASVAKSGLFGPRLTAPVAFMKGISHASFSTICKFLRDVKFLTTLSDKKQKAYG